MILCLINFIKYLLFFLAVIDTTSQNGIENIFSFLEFILLLVIFRRSFSNKFNHQVNILLSIYISVIITIHLLEGLEHKILILDLLQNSSVIIFSIFCIVQIAFKGDLDILHKPLLWVAIGSLFYFSMAVLLQLMEMFYNSEAKENFTTKVLLLNAGEMFRYFFYLLGAWLYNDSKNQMGEKYS